MRRLLIALVGLIATTCSAAADDSGCGGVEHLVSTDFRLPQVTAAIAAKNLNITVIGSASSTLADPAGPKKAYPAQMEANLTEKLPGVAVKVTTYVKARESAANMEKYFPQLLGADKPALVVWQTGTVEAIRRTDVDEFRSALDEGIETLQAAKADVVLMNMQYSPRTELMMSGKEYAEAMRFAALQHEIPLFDRFAVMHQWSELGTFDLNEITKKTDMAARVHACIGRLLARLVIDAAQLPTPADHAIR